MRVGQGTSGVLTAGAPRAGAHGMRASRAGRLAKGQRCAIRGYFFAEKYVKRRSKPQSIWPHETTRRAPVTG
eukprot:1801785-Prymnesium_polylepis.1